MITADTAKIPASVNDLATIFAEFRASFADKPYLNLAARCTRLSNLANALKQNEAALVAAVSSDFGHRAAHETRLTEIFSVLAAINHAVKHLPRWMMPRRVKVKITLGFAKAYVLPQPLGVIGIMSPWNFPINLVLSPLVGVLSAGNHAILKPSELTPATNAVLRQILETAGLNDCVQLIEGGPDIAADFAALPFDHLLFTGSTATGRKVMIAAAANLTPVTLELGGKSPALIAPGADLTDAARDIMFGKLLNAGQICIAPDYVLAPAASRSALIAALQQAAQRSYPAGVASPDFTAMISDAARARLEAMLNETRAAGVEIVPLFSSSNELSGKMAPALIVDPPDHLQIMQGEIFGPLLPIKFYDQWAAALAYINARPRPLSLYLFAKDQALIDQTLRRTIAGSVAINDTILQIAVEDLPFGGVGASGMGQYHGQAGFERFSHLKSVFHRQSPRMDRWLRPPIGNFQRWMLNKLMKRA